MGEGYSRIKYVSIQGKFTEINSFVKFIFCRFGVIIAHGYFIIDTASPSGWTHVIINYIAPENGQGIQVYYNGYLTGADMILSLSSNTNNPGDGHIVIWRYYTDGDHLYASVQLDELMFFNEKLTDSEIIMLSQF